MTTLYGLNSYVDGGRNDKMKKFAFRNLQWPLKGALVRCSQPYYNMSKDQNHTMSIVDITFLRHNRIASIISANHCDLDDAGIQRLKQAGISFYHFEIEDFHPPKPDQLERAAKVIEHNRSRRCATLAYCGYGQGRTGTFVAAWAMLKYMPQQQGANINAMCNLDFLKRHFGVETDAQVNAIRTAANLALPPAPIPAPLPMFTANFAGSGLSNLSMPSSAGLPPLPMPTPMDDEVMW